MLESIIILGAICVIYYVFYWSIRNDRVERIDAQRGLLRMRSPGTTDDGVASDEGVDHVKRSPNAPQSSRSAVSEQRRSIARHPRRRTASSSKHTRR